MNAIRIKGVVYVASNIIGFEMIDNHVTERSFIVLHLERPMDHAGSSYSSTKGYYKVSIECDDKDHQMLVYKQLMKLYQFPQMNDKGEDNAKV